MGAALALVVVVVAFCATSVATYVVDGPTWLAAVSLGIAVLAALTLVAAVANDSLEGRRAPIEPPDIEA